PPRRSSDLADGPAMSAPTATGVPPLQVERVRADFPILAREVNGRPMAYLDSAATSQKPQVVLDALARHYTMHHANVSRSAHTVGSGATEAYERARATAREFVGAPAVDGIVFTRNSTEAINLVAYAMLAASVAGGDPRLRLGPGDEVVISEMEHPANI